MKWMLLIAIVVAGSMESSAWAWDDEDEGKTLSYNDIVNELEMENKAIIPKQKITEVSDTKTYFGVAYSMSRVDVPNFASANITGSQFSLGKDFSNSMTLEALYRNLPGQDSSGVSFTLQEIGARAMYRPRINDNWHARLGAGISHRSLNASTSRSDASSSGYMDRWSLGLEHTLTTWLRLLPEISLRGDLLGSNSSDGRSLDAGVGFQVVF